MRTYRGYVVDYVCPFSAKMSGAIETVLRPLFQPGGKYEGKVKAIFRPQVQPWHGSSTFTHEAGLAVNTPHLTLHSSAISCSSIREGSAGFSRTLLGLQSRCEYAQYIPPGI